MIKEIENTCIIQLLTLLKQYNMEWMIMQGFL